MSCLAAHDPQLVRLADAIAAKVGPQRFHVWFNNSTRLELRNEALEIAVPNDFISEWISKNFSRPIADAVGEVIGGTLAVRFTVMPELFDLRNDNDSADNDEDADGEINVRTKTAGVQRSASAKMKDLRADLVPMGGGGAPRQQTSGASQRTPTVSIAASVRDAAARPPLRTGINGSGSSIARSTPLTRATPLAPHTDPADFAGKPRLRHDLATYVVGSANALAYNTVLYTAEFPGGQYNPLFVHGNCGLGKTHLLQGLCKKFAEFHPTKRWSYLTGEEFTNEFLTALRGNKLDTFRRKMRDLDLLVIDDVHFLGGKKATQEEFLHTFNAIEAMGKQVVMASDNHPKLIEEFGESLVNRFVSGMVVRVDPPNLATRTDILKALAGRMNTPLSEEVIGWIARRVTQNVRELEGAVTRVAAFVKLTGRPADVAMVQESLGDLDRNLVTPVRPENVMQAVCTYFGLEMKDLMTGRRQRTISLARSVAMYLIRKTAKLSFPEIGGRMGKRNHSTVISACRRIEKAVEKNEKLSWTSSVGERDEEAAELVQRLEEHSRAIG